ncbi:DUF4148 domain-containing protein [Paraburkholderia sediminicola]|uniref:DUF4148 domain-containing protein n=1 Tax=Paraburkholderia sediminicola TaxID=458836 RepID=UPI0038B92B72
MTKTFISMLLVASTLAIPMYSFAQTDEPLTRAEVRDHLVQVERAGYMPGVRDDTTYPTDVQAATAKLAMQDNQRNSNQSVGGVAQTGTSASGSASHTEAPSHCSGPADFCNIFFGN